MSETKTVLLVQGQCSGLHRRQYLVLHNCLHHLPSFLPDRSVIQALVLDAYNPSFHRFPPQYQVLEKGFREPGKTVTTRTEGGDHRC